MSRLVKLFGSYRHLALLLPAWGMPEIVAFGSTSDGGEYLMQRASRINGMDVPVPSAVLLPAGGMGFFGWPAIAGHRRGRDFIQQFEGWAAEEGTRRLTLHATDPVAKLSLQIELRFRAHEVLSMRPVLTNDGDEPFQLDRCMSGTMLVDDPRAELITFGGSWGREFRMLRETPGSGLWLKENRRGRTSHDRFPAMILGRRLFGSAEGTDKQNDVYGIHLGWSGNHVMAVDRLDDGRLLVHAGALFEPGEVTLGPGEKFTAPWAYMGRQWNLSRLADSFHQEVMRHLVKFPRGTPRPVTLNTWEGNYFEHKMNSLKAQADAAAALGIESTLR